MDRYALTLILTLFASSAQAVTIAAMRTGGVAPLIVHVYDSDNMTASDGSGVEPFHDYQYSWDFDDSASGTWGTTGKSKNSALGAVSAHVYDTAGTYTITLTVVNSSGSSIGSDTQQIVVTDPDTVFSTTSTICYSDTSSFTDCPSGATQTEVTNLATLNLANGYRHLFRRGGSWTASAAITMAEGTSETIIGAFGTCTGENSQGQCANDPAFTAANGLIYYNQRRNYTIRNLSISGTLGTNATPQGIDVRNWLIYKLNIDANNSGTPIGWTHWNNDSNDLIENMAVIDCTAVNSDGNTIYVGAEQLAIMGNIADDDSTTHVTRVWQAYRSVISHNRSSGASNSNTAGRHALKLHGPGYDGGHSLQVLCTPGTNDGCLANESQFIIVSDNVFGGSGPYTVSIGPMDDVDESSVIDMIFERNTILGDFGTIGLNNLLQQTAYFATEYSSIRNNIIDMSNNVAYPYGIYITRRGNHDVPRYNRVINNTIVLNEVNSQDHYGVYVNTGVLNTIVRNNLISFPDATGSIIVLQDLGTSTTSSNNTSIDDPSFVDPENASPLLRDFDIELGSTAIDAGYDTLIWEDFEGNSRSGTYDLGAFEYQSGNTGAMQSGTGAIQAGTGSFQ